MKLLYQSRYTVIHYDPNLQIQVQVWKSSEDFTENLYKQELLANANATLECRPKGLVSDAVNFNFVIHTDLQDWTTQNFFPKLVEAGVKRYGIIIGSEIFVQVSVEQTTDEVADWETLAIRYFDDLEKAKKWVSQT